MVVWNPHTHAVALIGGASCVALAVPLGISGLPGLALALGATGILYYFILMRRSIRRLALSREPFPQEWRLLLDLRVPFYRDLDAAQRAEFERDVLFFIRENRFAGIDGVEVTDELKLLAAASAVMLLFGRTEREYPRIAEILFYPGTFSEEYATRGEDRDLSGQVHPYGTVILSAPDLQRSFSEDSDGFHVGLHEFAHVLDLKGMRFDGVPLEMDPRLLRPWTELVRREMQRAGHPRSAIRAYGGTNEAEFFAVAVEVFFERPELLERKNPEVYAVLKEYFRPNRPAPTPGP